MIYFLILSSVPWFCRTTDACQTTGIHRMSGTSCPEPKHRISRLHRTFDFSSSVQKHRRPGSSGCPVPPFQSQNIGFPVSIGRPTTPQQYKNIRHLGSSGRLVPSIPSQNIRRSVSIGRTVFVEPLVIPCVSDVRCCSSILVPMATYYGIL